MLKLRYPNGKLVLAWGLAVMLTACATPPPPWGRSDTTSDETRHDLANCRHSSNQEVARPPGSDPDLDRPTGPNVGSSPLRQYDSDRSEQKFQSHVSRCMHDLGYVTKK